MQLRSAIPPLLFMSLSVFTSSCGLFSTPGVEPDDPGVDCGLEPSACACAYRELDQGVCQMGRTLPDGSGAECATPLGYYAVEVARCDQLDNDCDGLIDEGCRCASNGSRSGVCALGRVDPANGACMQSELRQQDESACDGYDNDCDGATDEGCPLCQVNDTSEGACAFGRLQADGRCTPPLAYLADESEQCAQDPLAGDGVDNDCDGEIDEGCACDHLGLSFGVCAQGVLARTTCQAPVGYEAEEAKCDGVDNDCDGEVDEGCELDDDLKLVCTPREETCNGRDDDCDAVVDEGCACEYAGQKAGVCALTTRGTTGRCQRPADYVEEELSRCDGLDNDCDGEVDEGCERGDELVQIALGDYHTCTLRRDGLARCFGDASYDRNELSSTQTYQAIAAGGRFSCGLTQAGALECVGDILNAGLLAFPPGPFVEISAGTRDVCARAVGGEVTCWDASAEQGGEQPPEGARFKQVSVGVRHACGVRLDDTVACWGKEASAAPSGTYRHVVALSDEACALSLQGSALTCWGSNIHLNGEREGDAFESISGEWSSLCGITAAQEFVCWGYDEYGSVSARPDLSELPLQHVSGGFHSCVLSAQHELICWGRESRAQRALYEPPSWTRLAKSEDHACGLRADGTAECFGASTESGWFERLNGAFVNGAFTRIATGVGISCALDEARGMMACKSRDDLMPVVLLTPHPEVACAGTGCCSYSPTLASAPVCHGVVTPSLLSLLQASLPSGATAIAQVEADSKSACIRYAPQGAACRDESGDRLLTLQTSQACQALAVHIDGWCVACGLTLSCTEKETTSLSPLAGTLDAPVTDLTCRGRNCCGLDPQGALVCQGELYKAGFESNSSWLFAQRFSSIKASGWDTCGLLQGSGELVCWSRLR